MVEHRLRCGVLAISVGTAVYVLSRSTRELVQAER